MRNNLACVSVIAICAAQMFATSAGAQTAPAANGGTSNATVEPEIIVTANKRSEKLQKAPIAVQVLDNRSIEQHDVNSFQEFLKLVPTLTTQTQGPNQTSIYMRGVSSGDNANHSGPQPTVGSYLDELPITTIGGTLDVHPYDLARIEVLPGPQGTLYGASSEAGTVRIITNQPDPSHFSAGYSVEGSSVAHGEVGYVGEGFVNVPLSDDVAVRLVAFDERDAGYINNVYGTRKFATSGVTINNGPLTKSNVNRITQFGGRAALKVNLDENWSITPSIMGQKLKTGLAQPGYMVGTGQDFTVQRFQSDSVRDSWWQAGLTVNGRIGNFDLTYAGGMFLRNVHQHVDYTDYSIAYDQAYGSGHYWQDSAGNPLPTPLVLQNNTDRFRKVSNEIRLASPSTDRLRFQVGAFQEIQFHDIQEPYMINGFSSALTIPGFPNTTWLTKERRTDRDYAAFAEASYDILPGLTATGGIRLYQYRNSLYGYFGFSQAFDRLIGSNTGMGKNGQNCMSGKTYQYFGTVAPCVNLDKSTKGHGETHKLNVNYKIDDLRMVYFTYSTGYRPGGVNRNAVLPPYGSDKLRNFEVGLKSQWWDRRVTLNLALYDEAWQNFQFSFYGLNNLTQIQNAPAANIKGAEASIEVRPISGLSLSGNLTVQNPKLDGNICPSNPATGAFVKTCSNAVAVATDGTQLPFTSKFKGAFNARYTFALTPDYEAYLQGSLAYRSRQTLGLRIADQNALGTLPAFTTIDLFAGVKFHNLSVDLFAKNLTDERGLLGRYSECNNSVCKQLYNLSIPPRTIGVRFSQRF